VAQGGGVSGWARVKFGPGAKERGGKGFLLSGFLENRFKLLKIPKHSQKL